MTDSMGDARALKDEASRAMGRRQWKTALELYAQLARLEPKEGTWYLRAGDAARRLGEHRQAIEWYERAGMTYSKRGFTVRAIAVGKMVEALDPGNDRVLRSLESEEARPAVKLIPPPPASADAAAAEKGPPPIPDDASAPPLRGRLSGPTLERTRPTEAPMESVEIVFDDADDGIPIVESDILYRAEGPGVCAELDESGEDLLANLPSFPIFEILPCDAFADAVSRMSQRRFEAGEAVVRQGEQGTSLYAIVDGEVIVYLEGQKERPLTTLGPGDVFGEMALVLDQPRTATVEAATDTDLFEMDRQLLRDIFGRHPQLGAVMGRLIKRRLVDTVMATAPMFAGLDPAARRELMARFEVREAKTGTRIVEEGTRPDGLYLLLAGEVGATTARSGSELDVGTLGPGQILGAAGLIDPGHTAAASFAATRDLITLRLPRSAYDEIICCYPPVLEHLATVADEQKKWIGEIPML